MISIFSTSRKTSFVISRSLPIYQILCPAIHHPAHTRHVLLCTTPAGFVGKSQRTTSNPRRSKRPLNHSQTSSDARSETLDINPPAGSSGTGIKFPFLDALLTTFLGLGAVFVGGIVYVRWYKRNVLDKIEAAFQPGYDPALELAKAHSPLLPIVKLRRKEQDIIDHIIHGHEPGHYFMLLGPKGSGKGTMIFDAMAACDADGVSMCEAHPDLEVFRLRLGKALNYVFNEDSQTGLFQRRDPREGGPALDIERAMNKLEKVALRCARTRGKPLILIINNAHFFQNNEGGRIMLLQLQQRAEAWAASGILTMVFTSDEFWPFYTMRKNGSRMHVISIYDFDREESIKAISQLRQSAGYHLPKRNELEEPLSLVGGRLTYLNEIAKSKDMSGMAKHLLKIEKGWLLSKIGLIPDFHDDVVDEQKWCSCSWLLLCEFVKREEHKDSLAESSTSGDELLPAIPYWKCRQIMTRSDFLDELDRLNIISIDIHHNVRPDSKLILRAAQEVVNEEGFHELLKNVRNRIDEFESLQRTRELTFKDLDKGDMIRLSVDRRSHQV